MFSKLFQKILKPISAAALISLSALALCPILTHSGLLSQKIQCLDTIRANKPQLIKLTNTTKQQLLILIYNRQSQSTLHEQIIKYQQLAQKLGIQKVVLVDQTDIRHLQTFTRILRQDIDEQDKKQNKTKQPRDLRGKIKVMYVCPLYDTNKPFIIDSIQQLSYRIKQIRGYIKINPNEQQIKRSLQTFNKTTIVKNCYNQTCIDEYKQKVRTLIQLQLLKQKSQNYQFFITTSKSQASKISSSISQTSNKQQIYIFRNDILGKTRQLYTQFLQKQGNRYQSKNKFMMMIRPRVHILSKSTLNTDLYWYVTCLRINTVPTFAINNTANNMPVRVLDTSASGGKGSGSEKQQILWLKGHYKEVELIRKIKQKYGNGIEVLIMQTNVPSQLFRQVYLPERYSIFNLTPEVPYPKMLIKPPLLNMDMNVWGKIKKTENLDQEDEDKLKKKDVYWSIEGDDNTEGKWQRIIQKIDKFKARPMNYNLIKMYKQKQMEINAQRLIQLLQNRGTQQSKISQINNKKWIFRICGLRNSCLLSAYQKYGIDISTPVYYLDGQVQNVSIDEGDYQVDNDQINPL